ncbi:TetR family transcriptional regulator [Lactobacillus nasalidis]|uniref:TetR family transcriptional regulator n=1 Tax=Lactobacillus nasalidis TaxID=2797258 RepID=A0ABQ3W7I2_9LACO|nr:TetR/AcrR family transcriptional regulator [Lactobacillus nasalidis]GHV96884.1 TetR family transcriptional regulator [Lactobacillus nasalidis]GHW00176.1 TetR family transcriptional regulator [Lactobacillus nasalidis]GHW01289.1 TetR family transcriptional regulator [Lactobacillus nasalidis]
MAQMHKAETHRRTGQIKRTREDFAQALAKLLKDQKLSDLTVGELADAAGYSRRTFYRHYQDPADILKEELEGDVGEIFAHIKKEQLLFPEITEYFFSYWSQRRDFLQLLARNDCLHLFFFALNDKLAESAFSSSPLKNNPQAQQFAIGGMFQMLIYWYRHGMQETPKEMKAKAEEMLAYLGQQANLEDKKAAGSN